MSQSDVFPVPEDWRRTAMWTPDVRDAALARLESDPDGYWRDLAARLDWIEPFTVPSETILWPCRCLMAGPSSR